MLVCSIGYREVQRKKERKRMTITCPNGHKKSSSKEVLQVEKVSKYIELLKNEVPI
jgi:hypothetical protein